MGILEHGPVVLKLDEKCLLSWGSGHPCFKALMIYLSLNILLTESAGGKRNIVTREVTIVMTPCCPMIVPIVFYVTGFEFSLKI